MNITVEDQATTVLQNLRAAIVPQKFHAAIATKVKQQVQNHLRAKGPNKKGWPTTDYYLRAAHATTSSSDATSAIVTIDHVGIRQRYEGGSIETVTAKALTIPIHPLSYGRHVRDFRNLIMIKTRKGTYLVQMDEAQSSKARRHSRSRPQATALPRFLFKLAGSVYQNPDPTVLPSREEILATAVAEVNRNIQAATK